MMIDFKNVSKTNFNRIAILALFLIISLCRPVFSQQLVAERYKVPAIYLPELKRPPIALNYRAMEKVGTGFLPKYDGEPFHVNLEGKKSATDFDEAKAQLSALFEQIGLKADLTSIGPSDKVSVNQGLREDKRLDEYQKPYENAFQNQLKGKIGKLDEKTTAEVRKRTDEMKKQAQIKSTVYAFKQQYNGITLDNAGLVYVNRENRSPSVRGNIFTQINVTNQPSLKESDSINAAIAHVKKYAKVKSSVESVKPEMVIVPYADGFKYAWKMIIQAEDGPYRLWIDAENGKVLQLLPQFFFDSARGLAFTPDPNNGTAEMTFEVDPPSNGTYRLSLSGELTVHNNGADGVTSTDLTIPSGSSGQANFNVVPLNGTAVERTSTAGYNSRFQEINTFAWLYHLRSLSRLWGSQPLPPYTANVNLGGDQNAYSSGYFYICNATTNTSTSCNDLFNSANDATVLTHEYGHNINRIQYAVGGGSMTGSINEGLADFWSDTIHNTDTFGRWWAHNCPIPVQTGNVPRQSETSDVFPEHRYFGGYNKESHADGQMISWALWNVRREFLEQAPSGVHLVNSSVMDTMTTAGLGIIDGISDKRVHDSFVDFERQLASNSGTSWLTIKILSGFARAGLFLSDREAIIDIDDDYLNRNSATTPTFTIWTGRDYTFDASENAVTTGALPFNTRYRVEVANDAGFSTNYFSSGWQAGVTTSAGGTATWQLDTAMWNALKTGNKLYYRVQTTDADGGNVRNSNNTGDLTVTNIDVPFAVINDSGEREPTICEKFPALCKICKRHPSCYLIYDPWWRFKCPACSIDILVRPGDEVRYVTVYDNSGRRIGKLGRLKEPVVVDGIKYTHAITVKARKDVSYVLKAETAKGKRLKGKFNPTYTIRKVIND